MKDNNDKNAPTGPSALEEARSSDAVPGDQNLPPVQHSKKGEPGNADDPHHGQSGHAGSGKDAQLESVGQSQSDRAAGSSH
ncbi:MAG: hypothetical protein ACR2GG_03240 [Gemmatimonadaceae bacterium]